MAGPDPVRRSLMGVALVSVACGGALPPETRPSSAPAPGQSGVTPAPIEPANEGAGESADNPGPYPDSVVGLERLAHEISEASEADSMKLGEALALPDHEKWFVETFGAELGAALAADYAEQKPKLGGIRSFFDAAKAKGRTRIFVERHTTPDDPGENTLQEFAIRKMQRAITLYTINCVEPSKTIGASLWSFAYVDGYFRYLGKMKATKPGALPIDELSKKDLKEALEGRD